MREHQGVKGGAETSGGQEIRGPGDEGGGAGEKGDQMGQKDRAAKGGAAAAPTLPSVCFRKLQCFPVESSLRHFDMHECGVLACRGLNRTSFEDLSRSCVDNVWLPAVCR